MIRALLVALLLTACAGTGTTNQGNNPHPPAAANAPPAGTIWFGETFDPETIELRGRKTTVGINDPLVMVIRLPESKDASDLLIRSSLDGAVVASVPANAEGSSDLWGFSLSPLLAAGSWRYEVTDIGGNVLASGTITAE